jgi:SAM-dependent methyltransferase
MWSAERTRIDCDRIAHWFPEGAAHVLDIPCGEGRVALELARRGMSVTGLDQSPELLGDARAASAREGLDVAWREGDMRELDDVAAFDAAVCWWGSFGYFDDADDPRFSARVARALRPGGTFVIDMNLAESLLPQWQSRGAFKAGEVWVIEERSLDLETMRVEVDWTFLADGEPAATRHSSIRLYTFRALATMLREAGFATVSAYDQATFEPFTMGHRRATVVATR